MNSGHLFSCNWHWVLCDKHQLNFGLAFSPTQLGEIECCKLGNFQKAFDFHRQSLPDRRDWDAKFELTQGLLAWQRPKKSKRNFERWLS